MVANIGTTDDNLHCVASNTDATEVVLKVAARHRANHSPPLLL